MEFRKSAAGFSQQAFADPSFGLESSDPDFSALFSSFAFDEVVGESRLDEKTRLLSILSALLGCQGLEVFRAMVPMALQSGVTPVMLKEMVYQGTAYLGLGRTLPFLRVLNEALTDSGLSLPLPSQQTIEPDARIEAGNQAQVDIFGEQMRGYQNSGPQETRHIHRWLSGNCFGDYYTRSGLNYRQRELITFCILAAQGGCEPQLVSHAAGNFHVGNDRSFLIDVVSQCLPYIGYPRSLNALRCVNEASK